jgi:hypothetical protein
MRRQWGRILVPCSLPDNHRRAAIVRAEFRRRARLLSPRFALHLLVQLVTISCSILGRQGRCGGHDLGDGFGRPVKRRGMLIPCFNKLGQLCVKLIFGFTIYTAQAFALADTEPLFHLMHP